MAVPVGEEASRLSALDVWAMGLGCMVGWGAFVMPGTTFLPLAGPAGTVLALVIGIVVMLIIAHSFAYLMEYSPRPGGVYSYAKAAFGRDHAFLCSWFLCLSYLTIVFLNGTALFLVVRTVLGNGLQLGPSYMVANNSIYFGEVVVSVCALAGIGLLFVLAQNILQRLHTVLSLVLVAGTVAMACACLPHLSGMEVLGAFGTQDFNPAYAVVSLVILAPWAFVGFEVISFDSAYFGFAVGRAKRITIESILVAGLLYIVLSLVSVTSVPDGFASWGSYIDALGTLEGVRSVPTFNAARSAMGIFGLIVMTISALSAILTGIIGGYRATMRVLSAMAEDHILSERFSKVSFSILFIMVLSILISLLGRNTLTWFVDLTALGAIVVYGYTSAAAWKLAKASGDKRAMVTGACGTVISVVFGVVQLVPHVSALEAMGGEAFLLLSLWCLLGFVFYWRTIERSPVTEFRSMSTSGIVLFSLLVYCAFMWFAKLLASQQGMDQMYGLLVMGGVVALAIVFVGLVVMLYIQNLARKKYETAERERIRAAESNLARSQFLFNMSHDIRTPMNAIIGYTNLALKEDTSSEVHSYLTKIEASSNHLLELIEDILEMSRIESGDITLEYAPTDLRQIFEDIRDLFAEQMRQKGIRYEVHTSQVRDRYVWCDRKSISRVMLNVVSNAYKFTNGGGTVAVSVWEVVEGEYNSYEIRVQDSGIGMSKEFVDRMFNAFERERTSTDSGQEGSGLGLAITKSILDLMGGTIEVLTSPGNGTEVIMCLRLRKADEKDMEDAPAKPVAGSAESEEPDFSGKRLLVVEDNDINMEIAQMILTSMGFEVEGVVNGKEALDAVAASEHGYYDAVIMDIQMPVMDGYEATRAIRALDDSQLAQIPILAMTANTFKEDVEAAFEAGMQAHIAKPVDIGDLTKALAAVLD